MPERRPVWAEHWERCPARLWLILPGQEDPIDVLQCEKARGHMDHHGTLRGYRWETRDSDG